MLRALALDVAGRREEATGALASALHLAAPQGCRRAFLDEGPPLRPLLSAVIAAQRSIATAAAIPLDYLADLHRAVTAGAVVP